MQEGVFKYVIFSNGDSAITVDFGNVIDEEINRFVISVFEELCAAAFPGIIDIIPAYSSITLLYNTSLIRKKYPGSISSFQAIKNIIEEILLTVKTENHQVSRLIRIPVCYDEEFATDVSRITQQKNISAEELIRLHTSKTYRVYMLGFLPGFAYMGKVDEKLVVPRKAQPVPVAPGSVGITGFQTAVYPFHSPGGWQIIGRTPVKFFNEWESLLKPGDEVEFFSITKHEFENY